MGMGKPPSINHTHSTELPHASSEFAIMSNVPDTLRESSRIWSTIQAVVPHSLRFSSPTQTSTKRTPNTSSLASRCTLANTSTAVLRPRSPPETFCQLTESQKVPPCATSNNIITMVVLLPEPPVLLLPLSAKPKKLPSGHKKTIKGVSRCMVGIVAGGGRNEKPVLKVGKKHYMYESKRKMFPKVRGVCMNPVEHPHGGGNHQHVGKPTTVSRWKSAGRKVGLIAARRTGRIRGGA